MTRSAPTLLSDADIAEVQSSAAAFKGVVNDTKALNSLLDLRQTMRWLGVQKLDQGRLAITPRSVEAGVKQNQFRRKTRVSPPKSTSAVRQPAISHARA